MFIPVTELAHSLFLIDTCKLVFQLYIPNLINVYDFLTK